MASDSVNNKTKSEKRKNSVDGRKGKKSSVDGRSVSSMMRRKERGGCPALGEGLFPDVTTGCQVEFHGSDLRHNHSFHHIHVQEFYMCHNGHRMGQFTCPGGTLFSSQHETCDWKGKVILIKTILRMRIATMTRMRIATMMRMRIATMITLNPGGVQ